MNKNNDIINKFLLVGEKFMPEMHCVSLELVNLLNKLKESTNF